MQTVRGLGGMPSLAAGEPGPSIAHIVDRDVPPCGLALFGATSSETDPFQLSEAIEEFMRRNGEASTL